MKSKLNERLMVAILGLLLFGGALIWSLLAYYHHASTTENRLLWGTAILSIIGGAWFTYLLLIRRRLWRNQTQERNEQSAHKWNVWRRATLRVIFSSLLAFAPLLIRGSFIAAIFGLGTGFFLTGLVGHLSGHLPIPDENNDGVIH